MHILITGAGGIIGRHVCYILAAHYPQIEFTKFTGDLCEPSNVKHNCASKNYDAVIHLASMVAVNHVDAEPAKAYAVNVGGTANLLHQIMQQPNKPLFFLASSAHVYASKSNEILETDPIGSHTLYGRTKYMAEQLAFDIAQQKELPLCIGRIFSFYDPDQRPPFLYPNIMKRLESEDLSAPFELFGADSVRDISKACDIADIIIKLVMKQVTGTFNIASGQATKIRDFVASLTYKKLNIISKGSHNSLCADINKLKKALHDT